MKVDVTATLVKVEGNFQDEFSDIIGTTGRLYLNAKNNWYCPKNSGDIIRFNKKRATRNLSRIRVSTHFGSVFTFYIA